jgi:hypothetical protein
MDMTGTAGSYIPTILTPESLDGIREFTTSVYGGADGTFDGTLPLIATFTYDIATKITTVTLGEIPYIDYSFSEVNSGTGSMVIYVNDDVAATATVTTPTTRLYLTDGDEVEVHVNPIIGTPALTVDDDGVTIDVNTVGSSLVSDPVTVASDTKITAIGEVATGASTILEYQFTDYPGRVSFMNISRNYVNIANLTEDTALTSLSINPGDLIEVSTYSSFEEEPEQTTIQLYVDGSLFDSVSGFGTQLLNVTAETGKTYTFIGFVGGLV